MGDGEGQQAVVQPVGALAGVQDHAADEVVGRGVAEPFEVSGISSVDLRCRLDLHGYEAAVGGLGNDVDLRAAAVAEVVQPDVAVEPDATRVTWSGGYLLIAEPPVGQAIDIRFPLAEREIVLHHRTRDIRVRLRGDAVAAMENHGADLTYSDPL